MKLFIEDINGYIETFNNIYKVFIKKINNKNHLLIYYNSCKTSEKILLKEIRLAYLINIDTMHEYFRYEK